jgi:hypothetical protein
MQDRYRSDRGAAIGKLPECDATGWRKIEREDIARAVIFDLAYRPLAVIDDHNSGPSLIAVEIAIMRVL